MVDGVRIGSLAAALFARSGMPMWGSLSGVGIIGPERASLACLGKNSERVRICRADPEFRPMRFVVEAMLLASLAPSVITAGHAGSMSAPVASYLPVNDDGAIYSFPVNTYPDGWAALKAEPWGGSRRLTKVYDGTLFLVVGMVPGWKLVQFKSGERGWIAERLVGCCRQSSH